MIGLKCKIPVVGTTKALPEIIPGHKLRYKNPQDMVNMDTAFRTFDISLARLNEKNKKNLPIVSGWLRKKDIEGWFHSIVIADFDVLPPGYDSWTEFKLEMASRYGNVSILNCSVSNKVKLFFHVKSKGWMNRAMAVAFLQSVLNAEDFEAIDQSLAAVSVTYVNEHLLDGLRLACELEPYILESNANQNEYTDTRYHEFDGQIPQFLKFFTGTDYKKKKFVSILLACFNLIENKGFGLSQTVLANQCETSTGSISKWLKIMQKMKLLECVDANWEYKKKCKIYKATWMLATAIAEAKQQIMKTRRQPGQVFREAKQVYSLVPGEAYMYLLNKTKEAGSLDEIKDVIHGLNPKGLSLAKRIWRTHERYGRLNRAA